VLENAVDIALAGLLLAFSLPLLVFYSMLAKLHSACTASFRRPSGTGRLLSQAPPKNFRLAEDFGFEHAIKAYEQLIDSTHAEQRH